MQKLAILIVIAVLTVTWAEFCNICHPSGYACDSETTYRVCTGGRMLGKSIPCEFGLNCTDHPQICSIGRPACTHKCGKCNEERTIACMGPNKFALCHGKMIPSNVIIDCPGSGVCNNYLEGDFCAPPTPGYREAVCRADVIPTPPAPPPQPMPHLPSPHMGSQHGQQHPHHPSQLPPPMQQQPHHMQPSYQMPSHQQPSHQQPSHQQPSHQQPSHQMPPMQQHQPSHHQHQQPSHQSPHQQSQFQPSQPSHPSPHQQPMQPPQQSPHQQSPHQPSHQSPLLPSHQSHHQPHQSHQAPHQQLPPSHQQPSHQQMQPSHQQPSHQQQPHQQQPHHQMSMHTTPAPPQQTTPLGYPTTFNYPQAPPATTTVAPGPLTPQQNCAVRGRPGRYPVDSSMCRSYLYCYVTGGSLTGQELKCPGTTIFNPDIQKCVAADTYSCVGGGGGGGGAPVGGQFL